MDRTKLITPNQKAEEKRLEIYKRMSGERKLQISLELYQFAQAVVKASIIELHPGISDAELKKELIKRFSR
jgi:ABC-type Na+ transport system ATPase subunit NatA